MSTLQSVTWLVTGEVARGGRWWRSSSSSLFDCMRCPELGREKQRDRASGRNSRSFARVKRQLQQSAEVVCRWSHRRSDSRIAVARLSSRRCCSARRIHVQLSAVDDRRSTRPPSSVAARAKVLDLGQQHAEPLQSIKKKQDQSYSTTSDFKGNQKRTPILLPLQLGLPNVDQHIFHPICLSRCLSLLFPRYRH